MLYFKEKNIKTYDLGGTAHHTKTKDNHHIEEFKKEFGGYIVDEYQYESIPHFLAINIKRLFGIYLSVFLCVFLTISSLFFRPVAMAMRLKNASI